MNQVFVGGIALIITFILWTSKKESKGSTFLQSKNNSLTNSNTTSSFVQKKKLFNQEASEKFKDIEAKPFSKKTSLNSIETNKKLTRLISSSPNDRLLAIQIASQWKNKKALPFLRRGLKDSDSRVVISAAAAISSYKGKTIDSQKKSQVSRPPRNVSLIR
tara:strand:- start:248 stop:730 length:483 start_codon:yes stop_codon:yes gene_type:complete